MGEFADLKVITKPFADGVADLKKRTDRATMWAVRDVGRQVKREARKRAPVYKGTSGAAVQLKFSQFRRFQKTTGYKGRVGNNVVISGLLKNSISSSRRLKSAAPGEYSLKVGPRGDRVRLYAGKIESQRPFMRPAYDEVIPTMAATAAKAWAKAMNRG